MVISIPRHLFVFQTIENREGFATAHLSNRFYRGQFDDIEVVLEKRNYYIGQFPNSQFTDSVNSMVSDPDVIVVEQRTGSPAACWGGVLSEAAHHKHIRGVIVDGPVRDIDEINETGLPVFSRAVSALSARGRIHEAAVNVPVQVGDVAVEPGDLVIADGSGVAFIPAAIAPDVIAKAEEIAARERDMVAMVHENRPVSEIMDKKYETLLGTQE